MSTENNPEIPEIDLKITSTPVVAKPRKLKHKWSTQSVQDFKRDFGAFEHYWKAGDLVCKTENTRVYGIVQLQTDRGDVLIVTPRTGKRRVVFCDDLRKLNVLEAMAIESA